MRAKSCLRCRTKKLKCDDARPCEACKKSNSNCVAPTNHIARRGPYNIAPLYSDPQNAMLEEISLLDLSQNLLGNDGFLSSKQVTNAIPGGYGQQYDGLCLDWSKILPYELPDLPTSDILVDNYFASVNWFMLVIDERSFRQKANSFLRSDHVTKKDYNFCILMSVVWALGAHYLPAAQRIEHDGTNIDILRSEIFKHLETIFLKVIAVPTLETVQIGILLGSYNLFNGHPNLGFGILGSTVKIAQVLGLHKSSTSKRGDQNEDDQSPCTIWWALEIFDKYTAIAFGRPSTIDDSDCDVAEIDDKTGLRSQGTEFTTYLTYHKQKARLYRIVGPFLGRRRQTNQLVGLRETRNRLKEAYAAVPNALKFEDFRNADRRPDEVQLQAVALSLAYENLQIVLHRQTLFASYRNAMSPTSRRDALDQLFESSFRTSNIAKSSVARDFYSTTHAAMHIGMCALTSGIVLCGLLLDNPLFERKDQALLGVQQIIDLFMHFSDRSYQLADQGSRVLSVLKQKVMIHLGGPQEDIAQDLPGTQTNAVDAFLSSLDHESEHMDNTLAQIEGEQTLLDRTDLFTGISTDQLGAAWLWTDPWLDESFDF